MSFDGSAIEKSKFQVRPGLLLFAIVFFGWLLLALTPVPNFLGRDHATVRDCVYIGGIIVWCAGCFFLRSDSEPYLPLRMSITFVSVLATGFAIVAFALYTMIPEGMLIRAHLDYVVSRVLMPGGNWGHVLAEIGWLGSFFGRGRSRLLLVMGSTVIAMLWGTVTV